MSFEAKIAVLYDFDGFHANVVEIITRKVQSTGRGTTPLCISVRSQY